MGRRAKRRRVIESDLVADTKWEEKPYKPISESLFAMDRVTWQLRHPQRTEENVKDTKHLLLRRQDDATTVTVDDTVTVSVEVDNADQPTMTISPPSAPSASFFPSDPSANSSFPSDLAAPAVSVAPTSSLPAPPSVPQISTSLVDMTTATGSLTQVYLSTPVTPLPEATDTNNSTSAPTSITSLPSYVTSSVPFNATTLTSFSPSGTGMPNDSLFASNSSTNGTSGLPTTTLYSSSSLLNGTTTPSPSTLSTSTISESSPSSAATSIGFGTTGGAGSGPGGNGNVPTGSGNNGNGNRNGGGSSSNSPPPPGVVAGAVTGSVGGTAVLLLILILFVRWLRLRSSSHSNGLPRDESLARLRPGTSSTSQGPSMMQKSILPAAAVGALTRLSSMRGNLRPKSSPTLPVEDRGFQKLSGRKMPSQFGPEMDQGPMSMDFAAAPGGRPQRDTQDTALSDMSFYRDSQGYYGGLGGSPERPAGPLAGGFVGPSSAVQTEPKPETMRPSPARTPIIQSTDWAVTPPTTAGTSILSTFATETSTIGRSLRDGSHSSRFTEQM